MGKGVELYINGEVVISDACKGCVHDEWDSSRWDSGSSVEIIYWCNRGCRGSYFPSEDSNRGWYKSSEACIQALSDRCVKAEEIITELKRLVKIKKIISEILYLIGVVGIGVPLFLGILTFLGY